MADLSIRRALHRPLAGLADALRRRWRDHRRPPPTADWPEPGAVVDDHDLELMVESGRLERVQGRMARR